MSNKHSRFNWSNVIVIVLVFIVILGLLANLFNILTNGEVSFTFKHFLDSITSFESILPNFTITNFTISSDWGVFNFLKSLIEFFGNILTVLGFLAVNLLNLLKFVIHLVSSFFFL